MVLYQKQEGRHGLDYGYIIKNVHEKRYVLQNVRVKNFRKGSSTPAGLAAEGAA